MSAHEQRLMRQVRTLDLHGGVLQFRLLRVRIECAERERIRAVGVQDVATLEAAIAKHV